MSEISLDCTTIWLRLKMNTTTAHLSEATYYLMRNQNSKIKKSLFLLLQYRFISLGHLVNWVLFWFRHVTAGMSRKLCWNTINVLSCTRSYIVWIMHVYLNLKFQGWDLSLQPTFWIACSWRKKNLKKIKSPSNFKIGQNHFRDQNTVPDQVHASSTLCTT